MKIKIHYLVVLQLVITFCGQAQSLQRIEIPVPTNMEVFSIPIKEKGVIVLSQTSANSFNLKKYDTDLNLNWNLNGTIGNNLDYVTHSFDGKHVYLLFSKYKSNTYEIIKIYPGPGFIEKYQIFSIDKIELSDFEATDNVVFLSGMVKNAPVILFTDLVNKKSKVLPTAFKGLAEVQSMETDTLLQRVNITFAVGKVKDYQLIVKSFDLNGMPLSEIQLDPEDDFAMMNGRLNTVTANNQIMFGTYGYKNTIGSQKGPYSQGIYLTKIDDNEITETKFYDFTDFKNYFAFLSPKQREKQEKKVQDKKEKGKDLKLSHRMLVHEVIKQGDNYILVAEAFYPEYKYNNNYYSPYGSAFGMFSPFYSSYFNPYRWGYGNWGMYSPFSNYYGYRGYGNREIFDGWKYTHGIVAAFDKAGNLLWDNNIELKNVKTQTLKEKVKVNVEGDIITMSYSDKGEIFSKTLKNGIVIDELKSKQVSSEKEGDSVKRTSTDDIELWYGNYFLATGIQRITNDENGRRNVFYLNKVSF
ncbi:MAG: hypothetical protein V4683_18985 [Bacteroidota bacterium]